MPYFSAVECSEWVGKKYSHAEIITALTEMKDA